MLKTQRKSRVLVATVSLAAALLGPLGPRTLCGDPLVSFVIEATRPGVVGPDLRGPDFSNCDGVGDAFGQSFVDFPVPSPNAPGGVNVYDDGMAALRSVRDPLWFRDSLMTMSGSVHGTPRQEVANRGALHWFNGSDFPEILSFFEDGGVRPDVAFNIPQTGTVRFGPLEFNTERGRRFADVESIDMLSSGDTLRFTYANGEQALLVVEQATPELSRFRIEVGFAPNANGLVMETTNMFRDPLVNDTALVRSVDVNGESHVHPVLDFPGGLLTDVFLFREEFSHHNSLGPDIRIGEFTFEDAKGARYQGPLMVANESVVTDCAEEDNVVLSFFIPPLTGDFDGDGMIAQGDLDLVLLYWGTDSAMLPNFSGFHPTGLIDQDELDAVLLNWGAGLPLGSAIVPEPPSAYVAFVVVVLVFVLSRAMSSLRTRAMADLKCAAWCSIVWGSISRFPK
jgi:hypothetical protein